MLRNRRLHLAISIAALVAVGCGDSDGLEADAGDDSSVLVGESPVFDGCDSDGEITNYKWTIREAPSTQTESVDKPIRAVDAECSFTLEAPMVVDEVGDWVIELEVNDADGETSTDSVTVTVTNE